MADYREVPANERGRRNLAGFEHTCPKCGLIMRNSIRSELDDDVRRHRAFHAGQAAARRRGGEDR